MQKNTCCSSRSLIVAHIIAGIWIIFSIFYVANDIWQDFKQNELSKIANEAYSTAQTEIIGQLITEAEKCEPIPVRSGENQINLIKTDCK